MEYIIENDLLKVTVTTFGAQVKSVVRKEDGVEHMWQADPAVWGYHAPIMFPHAGRVVENTIEAKGQKFTSKQHGFARTMEHTFVEQTENSVVLELTENPQTLKVWPYRFRLQSIFTLEKDVLHHTLAVENLDEDDLYFGIGYHPAYAIPFDGEHTVQDYELRFDSMQSPLCVSCMPNGLVTGECYSLGNNISSIPLTEDLFANDSHAMVNLTSKTLGVYEKDTGRAVVCGISGFPYTLIWSMPGELKFVCIEPWHSLPSLEGGSTRWEEKPAAACLAPGESWNTTMSTAFVR